MAAEGSSSRVTRRQSSATVCAEFNYRLGKTMGFGAFSKVKSATHSLTGQKVAIKIMNRHKMKDMEDKGIYPSFLWDDALTRSWPHWNLIVFVLVLLELVQCSPSTCYCGVFSAVFS
jgi:serine/threonine protein kinase